MLLWSVHTCSSRFICFILLGDSKCGDSKLLLDHIFANYSWKPISVYPCVQLPAFDILFVFHCKETSTVGDSKILLETHHGLILPSLFECTYISISSFNKYKTYLDFIKYCYMDISHKSTVSIVLKYSTISFKIRKSIAFIFSWSVHTSTFRVASCEVFIHIFLVAIEFNIYQYFKVK